MSTGGSYLYLCLICGLPFVMGIGSTLIVLVRLRRYGRWGLMPFGGTLKKWWEERRD